MKEKNYLPIKKKSNKDRIPLSIAYNKALPNITKTVNRQDL